MYGRFDCWDERKRESSEVISALMSGVDEGSMSAGCVISGSEGIVRCGSRALG